MFCAELNEKPQLSQSVNDTSNAVEALIEIINTSGYATWFTARGAIRIALRQLLQNRK